MDGKNRFFLVEAAGDIDEDENNRIACTQITLLKELTPQEFAFEGMSYMILHPDRSGWERNQGAVIVRKNEAEAKSTGAIAIARGSSPRVRGPEGSILGLLVESRKGIVAGKYLIVKKEMAGKWLTLTKERKVEVVEESEG